MRIRGFLSSAKLFSKKLSISAHTHTQSPPAAR
jgi:hypothetical protein